MARGQGGPFEREARETVEELLSVYELPPRVRRQVNQLRAEERYVEALEVFVRTRRSE